MKPALADQLAAAARLLAAVAAGQSLSTALPALPPSLRPGVQALVFDALRHWGLSMALRRLLCRQAPPPLAAALLELTLGLLDAAAEVAGAAEAGSVAGADAAIPATASAAAAAAYQASLRHLATPPRPLYPAHTLVDQAVAALRPLRLPPALKGLVNACLRRFVRERAALRAQALRDPVARWNHPLWWLEQLQRDHPQHWEQIVAANQRAAPMVLRVNRRRSSRADYLQHLKQAGQEATPWGADGVQLAQPLPVEQLPGWAQGWVSVQDGAAQLAAPLLLGAVDAAALGAPSQPEPSAGASAGASTGLGAPAPRLRILDACAAPGGKTAHLLEAADAELWALDLEPQRCERIAHNLQRLGLQAQVRCGDAADPGPWWDGQPFDAILLDAPCSASGIVRRHPDVLWLRRPTDIAQLAAQQRRLLEALWPLLRPGGHLLYATCSVFVAEGEGVVQAFVQQQSDAQRLPAPGQLLPGCGAGATIGPDAAAHASGAIGDNLARETDGFFYALLRKRA
ncbi:tRNA and rRNA cytosine-C5-methylase [Serpentinimonas maccroryi]|uniref:tRNA and rRNA cytosine-C5-methylase n=1 Tax=Serpentinimonas maccroryi TaxID=1458426 RepID=A0A060NZ91_9BURK|nr:16S rRNA (cytosine(967)-C(5))-methyltransferase RsmB [Serpentinimonas maccroryi]BAO84209.1 tRNA and rRNA cytosine-C5-methylase [Serpentinimonas maccroryi]